MANLVNYRDIPAHRLYYYIEGTDDAILRDIVFPQLTYDQCFYLLKVLTGEKLSLLQISCPETDKIRQTASKKFRAV